MTTELETLLQTETNQIIRDNEAELAFIVAYENGEITEPEDLVNGFQLLIDSGIVWHLQGHYGRVAHEFISTGLCTAPSYD
jgi:hypothetical protein